MAFGPVTVSGLTDYVYDQARGLLYITTSSGSLLRYDPATGTFQTPLNLGGGLSSVAITPDGQYLLVGHSEGHVEGNTNHTTVDRINLTTMAVEHLDVADGFPQTFVFDLAVAANGQALLTTDFPGTGWVVPRTFDAANGHVTLTFPPGAPQVSDNTGLFASETGAHVLLEDGGISAGRLELYDSASGTVTHSVVNASNFPNSERADISEHAGLIANLEYQTVAIYDLSLNLIRSLDAVQNGWQYPWLAVQRRRQRSLSVGR